MNEKLKETETKNDFSDDINYVFLTPEEIKTLELQMELDQMIKELENDFESEKI